LNVWLRNHEWQITGLSLPSNYRTYKLITV